MQNKTVLISGIGIGGPTLAYWLRGAGYNLTLVERGPALRKGGYVIDFWGLGYDIAERMGLTAEINRPRPCTHQFCRAVAASDIGFAGPSQVSPELSEGVRVRFGISEQAL